MMYFEEKNII